MERVPYRDGGLYDRLDEGGPVPADDDGGEVLRKSFNASIFLVR